MARFANAAVCRVLCFVVQKVRDPKTADVTSIPSPLSLSPCSGAVFIHLIKLGEGELGSPFRLASRLVFYLRVCPNPYLVPFIHSTSMSMFWLYLL